MTTANRPLVSSSSSSSSHVKQNQLLYASKQGKVEEVKRLLKLGEPVKQRDYKGNTPLHCASKRGHYAVVQLLLENGAPVDLLNDSDKSPMDLSTQPKVTKLLTLAVVQKKEAPSLLLSKKQIFLESTKSGSSSPYPLHVAAKEGNSKELLRLLDLGKKIGERDRKGNTALHLASMHGRLSTVKLLIERGGSVQTRNASKETPLDLAKCWGQSEVVSLLLKKHEQLVSSSSKVTLIQNNNVSTTANSKDPEGQAYLQFEAAYEAGKAMDQIRSLDKLVELRLEKKDYFGAAHLINGAIAVATRSRVEQSRTKSLYQKLMEIEQLFLTKELGLKAAKTSHPATARNELKKIREGAARRLQQKRPIQEIQGFLTKGYKIVLCNLIRWCMDLLGKERPKGFAVMGLGSMARDEMCPYSDVEFGFVVRNPTQQNLAYFRHLSQLLTLKMINLGETKYELIRSKRVNQVMQPAKSLTTTGFSMDIGGLCPEGKKGIYELIGSPRQLANFQTPEWLQQNESEIILVNAMTTVCHVMGDESLITDYKKRIESILNEREGFLSLMGSRLREGRAIELMRGYVSEFKPRLDQDKIALRGFDVKQELYRLLQTVISGLALYYGIRATSTSQRLRELQQERVISKQGAGRLQRVFSTLLRLRVETHLFYGTEKEVLYHSRGIMEQSTDDLYPITKEIQQEIIEAYKSLVPLHQRAERFVQGDKTAFANSLFYDSVVGNYDDQQRKGLNFDPAEQSAQVATALNPNNPFARSALGLVQGDLGKAQLALHNHLDSRNLLIERHGDIPHPAIAENLNHLGAAYYALSQFLKAADCYKRSVRMFYQIYRGQPHRNIAFPLNNLGIVYRALGNYSKAIEYYEASLKMKRAIYGKEKAHPVVASSLMGLGTVYEEQGNSRKAVEYFGLSLKMFRTIHGKEKAHPSVAMSLQNLATAYRNLGRYRKAIDLYDQSLKMFYLIYGKEKAHPSVAMSLSNLGTAYCSLHCYREAIEYIKRGLKMRCQIYKDKPHSAIAVSLNNLGKTYEAQGKFYKAIKYHEQSLKMQRAIYGKEKAHPNVVKSLDSLSNAYYFLGKYPKAIEYYEDLLKMQRAIYGKEKAHPAVAASLNNLGNIDYSLGNYPKAIDFYEASLKMKRAIYGKEKAHPAVADGLNNLGAAYRALGNFSKAIEYYESSLKMTREIYGKEKAHSDVADSLNNLGIAYSSLSNYSKAIEYHEASLKMKRVIYGKEKAHPSVADSLNNLGWALIEDGKPSKGLGFCKKALLMQERIYNNKPDYSLACTLDSIGCAHRALGNSNKALKFFQRSYDMCVQTVGANHPTTKEVKDNLETEKKRMNQSSSSSSSSSK